MRKTALLAAVSAFALAFGMPNADAKTTKKGASAYAPGQLAKKPGAKPAKYYAPGQRMKRETRPVGTTGASGFAPSQKNPTPSTTGVRVR